MFAKGRRILVAFGTVAVGLLLLSGVGKSQTWTPLTHPMPYLCQNGGGDAPLLLTDGSVLVQDSDCSDFWRLVPDAKGSYVNGTWSQTASLPPDYGPLYHSAAVLPDGRVIIEGGEYNLGNSAWTPMGAIFDPVANTWTPVAPPSFFGGCCGFMQMIGDAESVVLSTGTYMQANCCNGLYSTNPTYQAALLDAKTLTWTETGTGKADSYNEEGWIMLPSGKVLTVDVNNPTDLTNSEIYDPESGAWHSAGSTVVKLDATNADGSGAHEIGPQVL